MNPDINQSSKEDYPELIKIWERSVRSTHKFLSASEIAFYKEQILTIYFDAVKLYKINHSSNGEIIGFMGVSGHKLEMLFIDDKYFGKGYGSALLDYAVNNLGIKEVDVNEENKKAYDFYLKKGFKNSSYSSTDGEGKNHPIISLSLE